LINSKSWATRASPRTTTDPMSQPSPRRCPRPRRSALTMPPEACCAVSAQHRVLNAGNQC
jgi:hypothetical protein